VTRRVSDRRLIQVIRRPAPGTLARSRYRRNGHQGRATPSMPVWAVPPRTTFR